MIKIINGKNDRRMILSKNNTINEELITKLIDEAFDARNNSYSPYSNFKVGAALLCEDGRIIHGCNIENSSYPATNCAERTAIFSAISNGIMKFSAIAIVGGSDNNIELCYPCGICLQVMAELCDIDKFNVISAISKEKYEIYTLNELLPKAFRL